MAKKPPNQIAWLKGTKGRHGKLTVITYYAIRTDGSVRCVDVTRNKTCTIQSFSSKPVTLEACTQKEFDDAFNQQIIILKQLLFLYQE
jgi:hypothetical protein